MAMPVEKSAFPPNVAERRYSEMQRSLARYSADPGQLAQVSGGVWGASEITKEPENGSLLVRAVRAVRDSFWGGPLGAGVQDTRQASPIAEQISRTKAVLIYGEAPQFIIDGPLWEEDEPEPAPPAPAALPAPAPGAPVAPQDPLDAPEPTPGLPVAPEPEPEPFEPAYRAGDPKPETVAAQQELDNLVKQNRLVSRLLAGAEIGSALGSYCFRIATTPSVDYAILNQVHAYAAIPEYHWGVLTSVCFWSAVHDDGTNTWRHFENHANDGTVEHAVYRGTKTNVGEKVPLSSIPASSGLSVDEEGKVLLLPGGGVTAVSIPNALPDPSDLTNEWGRSDYTRAVLQLCSNADKALSDMMDSVDDGKSRLLLAKYLLGNNGPGHGLEFDSSVRRFISSVTMPPQEDSSGRLPIEQVQFDMRTGEYWELYNNLRDAAFEAAGLNAQTMGDGGDVQQTATEYSGKNKWSMASRDLAIGYAQPELEAILTSLFAVHVTMAPRTVDGQRVQPFPVRVVFPEAIQPALSETAAVAEILSRTGATTEEVVRATYPALTETEVGRLAAERDAKADKAAKATMSIDPITFGLGGEGVKPADGDQGEGDPRGGIL